MLFRRLLCLLAATIATTLTAQDQPGIKVTFAAAGKTEQIVGSWLKRQPRDKVILATKATGPGRSMSWIRGGPSGFDAKNLTDALEGSLKRLQTDYIDLYISHWQDATTPIAETMEALEGLKKQGKIRVNFHLNAQNSLSALQSVKEC